MSIVIMLGEIMKHNIIHVSLVSCALLLPEIALASDHRDEDLSVEFMDEFRKLQVKFISSQLEHNERDKRHAQQLELLRNKKGIDPGVIRSMEAQQAATEKAHNDNVKKIKNAIDVLKASKFAQLVPDMQEILFTHSDRLDQNTTNPGMG